MVKIQVEVFSDTICPWCYIGKKHLDQAIALFCQRNPHVVFEVEWRPFYLHPNLLTIEDQSQAKSPGRVSPEIQRLIVHAGSKVGITFRFNAGVTGHSVASHALLRFAMGYSVPSSLSPSPTVSAGTSFASSPGSTTYQGISPSSPSASQTFIYSPISPYPQSRLLDALFAAHFEQGMDVSSPLLLLHLAETAGISRSEAQSILSSNIALRDTDTEATYSRTQVPGVPTFTIQGRWIVGGMQETEVLLGVFERAAREAQRGSPAAMRCENAKTAELGGGVVDRLRRGLWLKEILLDENVP